MEYLPFHLRSESEMVYLFPNIMNIGMSNPPLFFDMFYITNPLKRKKIKGEN